MTDTPLRSALSATILAAALTALPSLAPADGEVNLYSSRHYDTDDRLFSDFEKATGITINRIEGNADELIARIKAEGANSPADILMTVDTSRLTRAKNAGVLQPAESALLEERIPAHLQDAENEWFGFSQRSRILFYSKERMPEPPLTYAELADPKYKGLVCSRSSTNPYTQTLLAAMVEHLGEEGATDWAQGVVDNFARNPKGGDIDQLRAVVSGECDVVISNTYYFARALRKNVKGVTEHVDQIGWVFPDQDGNGAHMNLSGAGLAVNAPNKENAILFLEYLAGDEAQKYFSAGNDEYPAVPGVEMNENIAQLGTFKQDEVSLSAVAENIPTAQKIFNQVGWK
ncbi:MAG: Fe(3+) ABC transporter substrate-binding protein [Mangrovicoccus sp.]|nr:Fe(3+) ABC transporter substrate-binding protein [Mangrovicoccus sp.]